MFRPKQRHGTSIKFTEAVLKAIARRTAALRISKADYLEALARADTGLRVPDDPHPEATAAERRRLSAWVGRIQRRGQT